MQSASFLGDLAHNTFQVNDLIHETDTLQR